MRVAVIGAGIVGVTTAQALHEDGHQVVVLERQGSVATETSFANAGVLAPGYVTPWAAPGMWRKVMGQWFERDAAVRLAGLPGPALLAWLWRWWRACDTRTYVHNRGAMLALARDSLTRLQALAKAQGIDHERGQGLLVLLRGEPELAQVRAGLKVLAELDVNFHLVGADRCRAIEPALEPATELKAGIHLPDAEVGNCRQFALQLKALLQKAGVEFRFNQEVTRIEAGPGVKLHCIERAGDAQTSFGIAPNRTDAPAPTSDRFDAVVVCAAQGSPALLAPMRLPIQAVHGYSITLPLRHFEAHPDLGPRAALMDERFKVAISRLGDRVRVAGSAELGGQSQDLRQAPLATLYRVLQDWFPSAARQASAQTWKGARPMLPDGPPAIGAGPTPGVWVNTGHGSSGWALSGGSARLIADLIGGRAPAVDPLPFSPLRWR
jgi:D-amino-acid dehydrogenase